MADPFTEMMSQLANMGFFTFLLPWLFTFAIVYGLLAKVGLFGGSNNRISALIGIIAAFFITPYAGPWLAAYFTSIFGGSAIILAGILTIVLFAAMIGIEPKAIGAKKYGIPIIAIIGIVLFFFAIGGDLGAFGGTTIGSNTIVTIIFIVILLAAIWLVIKGGEGETKKTTQPGQQKTPE